MTTFGDMVYALGGVPTISDGLIPTTTGSYFFVDSSLGNVAYSGKKPNDALPTIDAAVGKCTADKGDVIVVMPGHAENLSAATSLVADVAGITIVGLGNGANRPTLTITATTGKVHVSAAEITIRNIRILAGVDAIVEAIDVDAADCTIRDCEINYTSTYDILKHVDVAAGINGLQFINNTVIARDAAGSAQGINVANGDNITIADNYFSGDWSDAIIEDTDTSTTDVANNLVISGNMLRNYDTTDTVAANVIYLARASTGMIRNNSLASFNDNCSLTLDPGSCMCIENYVVTAIDQTGALVPATAST